MAPALIVFVEIDDGGDSVGAVPLAEDGIDFREGVFDGFEVDRRAIEELEIIELGQRRVLFQDRIDVEIAEPHELSLLRFPALNVQSPLFGSGWSERLVHQLVVPELLDRGRVPPSPIEFGVVMCPHDLVDPLPQVLFRLSARGNIVTGVRQCLCDELELLKAVTGTAWFDNPRMTGLQYRFHERPEFLVIRVEN